MPVETFSAKVLLKSFSDLPLKIFLMKYAFKIFLSIILFICLLDMSYGYYQFARFACMIAFALLAYFSFEQKRNAEVIIYIGLILLFQPFLKVALGRTIWNVVDVVVAVGLIVSIVDSAKKSIN